MKVSIFDILKDLSYTKKFEFEDIEKEYNVYMINRFLSMHPETIFYAYYLNNYGIDKRSHFLFLKYGLDKKKRFFEYVKTVTQEEINIICEYYDCSKNEAHDYFELLDEDDINNMKNSLYKGGKEKFK